MPSESRLPRWIDACLVTLFFAALATIAWGVFEWREQALAQIDTPENAESWSQWRQESARLEVTPEFTQRRAATSPTQPGVVLLSDHFAAVLLGILVTLSVPLFVVLWMIRAWIKSSMLDRNKQPNAS